jgi:CDGSH-type Zn-finger protein/uncharacterized Fe-S cluster protein YjdI
MSVTPGAEPFPSREQLIYWLHEAAEIEHNLMCCYLYAGFSLKRVDDRHSVAQREAVLRWRRLIQSVALEEMTHLALVGNLMAALGAAPHFGRPAFPVDSGPYPAGFVIRLQPFSMATIEHFKFLERPGREAMADGEGFQPRLAYRRRIPPGRLSPGPRDYETVGELYETIAHSLEAIAEHRGEKALFIGNPALQIDAALAPLPGMRAVTDLASALGAIATIVRQGEGAGANEEDSHFSRFSRMGLELGTMLAADPAFEPAWPAATNPVMNAPLAPNPERVLLDHPVYSRWLDIGNALYTTSLRCLHQAYIAVDRNAKATWLHASFTLMRSLSPVGHGLAARPASASSRLPHGGLSFTPLRTLALLPPSRAPAVLSERLGELIARARELPLDPVAGESRETWDEVLALLSREQASLAELAANTVLPQPSVVQPALEPQASIAATPATRSESDWEIARGQELTIRFNGRRCIHSRHCVLEAPAVFLANTPSPWIFPDQIPTRALIEVAHKCPSGAIQYEFNDGAPGELAPPVNQLRVWENGPYAFRAPLQIATEGASAGGFRATLCRCGQSHDKPWCDGSHHGAGFRASGELLAELPGQAMGRAGVLQIIPHKNGPLEVRGNLEICAATGRRVALITEARLCRCGQSRNKPFCDLSHVAAAFEAPGSES